MTADAQRCGLVPLGWSEASDALRSFWDVFVALEKGSSDLRLVDVVTGIAFSFP